MTIQLQYSQISILWDVIKFAAVEANNTPNEKISAFTSELLVSLMSGKAQVWATLTEGEEHELIALTITYHQVEALFGYKYLILHSVYGFKPMTLETVNSATDTFTKYAKTCGCQKVIVMTTDSRITKLFEKIGYKNEVYVYSKEL